MTSKKIIYIFIVIILFIAGLYFALIKDSSNDNKASMNINNVCDLEKKSLKKCNDKIITMTESDTAKYDDIKSMQFQELINVPGHHYESFFTSEFGFFRLVSKKTELTCDKIITVTGLLSLGESPCTSDMPQTKACSHLPRVIVEKFECN